MNITKILNRLEKLESREVFNTTEEVSLEEKLNRAKALFEKYYNSTGSEQQEFLGELNFRGKADNVIFTHQGMIDSYKSFGIGEE